METTRLTLLPSVFALVVLCAALMPGLAQAQTKSKSFTVSLPGFSESYVRDVPKHTNFLSVSNFYGNFEYKARVVNADTNVPITGPVPQGTPIRFQFLNEYMSYHTTGGMYDSPIGIWGKSLPPAPSCDSAYRVYYRNKPYKGKPHEGSIFAPVYIDEPTHAVQNMAALGSCTRSSNDSITCIAENAGTHNVRLAWGGTRARLYARVLMKDSTVHSPPRNRWPKWGVCEPLGNLSSTRDFAGGARNEPQWTVNVPAQLIPVTIKVLEVDGEAPNAPTLSTGGIACTTNVPFSLSMSATDPDGDDVRFLVDWNNDGAVDTYVPPSGYTPSGSTVSTSRTFTQPGNKAVQVRTQDTGGLSSGWKSISFVCKPPEATENVVALCADGIDNDGDGLVDLDDAGCLSVGDNDESEGAENAPAADLSIRAIPSLVRSGNTSRINWSAAGVTSCTVTAPNGDSWDGLESPVGGEKSSAITAQTVYTLRCESDEGVQTKTATVSILPTWREQ